MAWDSLPPANELLWAFIALYAVFCLSLGLVIRRCSGMSWPRSLLLPSALWVFSYYMPGIPLLYSLPVVYLVIALVLAESLYDRDADRDSENTISKE